MLADDLLPGNAAALRAAHMDAYASRCDESRAATIERCHEATRAKEKAQYEAEAARHRKLSEGSLLERMAASPLSDQAIAAAPAQWGISE